MRTLFISLIFVLGGLSAHAVDMSSNPNCTKNNDNARHQVQTPKRNNQQVAAANLNGSQRGKRDVIIDSAEGKRGN